MMKKFFKLFSFGNVYIPDIGQTGARDLSSFISLTGLQHHSVLHLDAFLQCTVSVRELSCMLFNILSCFVYKFCNAVLGE